MNDKTDNKDTQRPGDCVLAPWAHPTLFYTFWTYSYHNMNGAYNLRVKDDIKHNGANVQWHYIYYAYSRAR